MSACTFTQCPCRNCSYSRRESRTECCNIRTGGQKECPACNSVFFRKFNVDLHNTLSAFKAAQIMCPVSAQWLRTTPANAKALRQFPFLESDEVINDLVTELPNYLAADQDVIMPCKEDKVK